jgi:hypothetical protein
MGEHCIIQWDNWSVVQPICGPCRAMRYARHMSVTLDRRVEAWSTRTGFLAAYENGGKVK